MYVYSKSNSYQDMLRTDAIFERVYKNVIVAKKHQFVIDDEGKQLIRYPKSTYQEDYYIEQVDELIEITEHFQYYNYHHLLEASTFHEAKDLFSVEAFEFKDYFVKIYPHHFKKQYLIILTPQSIDDYKRIFCISREGLRLNKILERFDT